MAITPRASSTLALATRTNSTVTRPTGTTTGDYLVVALDAGGSSAAAITPPAGWASIGTVTYSDTDPWSVVLQLWGRFDDGAASWTWTHASRSTQAYATAYIGVNPTTPVDVAATTASKNGGGTNQPIAPSQTIATAGARGIIARGSWDGNAIAPPADWTERLDVPVMWVGDREWPAAGATGTVAVASGNGATLAAWGIIMAALRPAGSTPNQGSGSGTFTFTGAAAGKRTPKGSGSGTWAFAGAAAGKRTPKGSGSGTFTFTGGAAGSRSSSGSAAGVWAFGGTADGSAPAVPGAGGSTEGAWAFIGVAEGSRGSSGTAVGEHDWAGVADGEMHPAGSGAGIWSFDSLADGVRSSNGQTAGEWRFEGTADGVAPPVPGSGGVASGNWSFAGSAAGARVSIGTAIGSMAWAGVASGAHISSGSTVGSFMWVGAATGNNDAALGLLVLWLDGGVVRSGRWWIARETGVVPVLDVQLGLP